MTDSHDQFSGFPPGKVSMTQIPGQFFESLLPMIDNLAELKVLLFCFWALPQREGPYPYLRHQDFATHSPLMEGLAVIAPDQDPELTLKSALASAVERKALLCAEILLDTGEESLYFVNTERGRSAIDQIRQGKWQSTPEGEVEILPARPNIFQIYEANIGPLTPIIADELKDIDQDYPVAWVEEAIRIAVLGNKRSIRYITAILERWRREGKSDLVEETSDRQDDGQRYVSGKYADYIEH